MRALAGLLLLAAAGIAAAAVSVIELGHRPAAELLPALETAAGDAVTIAADGNRLIVRGEPEAIAELRGVVAELDRPAASLRVTLRRRTVDAEGRDGLGAVDRRVETTGTERARRAHARRAVRTIDGATARLDTGRRLPVREWIGGQDADGAFYGERLRYVDAPDSLYVTPRLQGDRVTVEVTVDRLGTRDVHAPAERRQLVTTVRGAVGEWLPLAAIDRRARTDGRTLTYDTRRRSETLERLELKVDRLP